MVQGSVLNVGQPTSSANSGKTWNVKIRQPSEPSNPGKPETLDSMLGPEARAQRVSGLSANARPFAAGESTRSWLDEASIPLDRSGTSPSASTGSEVTLSPGQEFVGDASFDQMAEELTKQYLAGLSSSLGAAARPFAAGTDIPGWLEAASTPLVRKIQQLMAVLKLNAQKRMWYH